MKTTTVNNKTSNKSQKNMKDFRSDDISDEWHSAGPLLADRALGFLTSLGLKKAKKRTVEVLVRNADVPPHKDGGVSMARILRVELKKVGDAKFERIINRWRNLVDDEETDEDDYIDDEEDAFVTGKIRNDDCALYGLANGGYLSLEFETDEETHIFVCMYRDYHAMCEDYPSYLVDQLDDTDPLDDNDVWAKVKRV